MANWVIDEELMTTVKAVIEEGQKFLRKTALDRLRLVEIGPRSENFADSILSCYISPNDPDDPDGWCDEEVTEPGREFNGYASKSVNELGGGQLYNLRFTIHLQLYYNDLGTSRQKAFEASRKILNRIHSDLLKNGIMTTGKFGRLQRADVRGSHLIRADKCVKRRRLIPAGSDEDVFYRGKLWLQFEVYMEPLEN